MASPSGSFATTVRTTLGYPSFIILLIRGILGGQDWGYGGYAFIERGSNNVAGILEAPVGVKV